MADGMESGRAAAKGPAFMPIRSVDELDAALAAADRPVLLDFYADWCRSCIEMEHKTYADPQIAQRLSKAVLLKADVTAHPLRCSSSPVRARLSSSRNQGKKRASRRFESSGLNRRSVLPRA